MIGWMQGAVKCRMVGNPLFRSTLVIPKPGQPIKLPEHEVLFVVIIILGELGFDWSIQ